MTRVPWEWGLPKGAAPATYNGMTMQDWIAVQKKSGRTEIEVDDNPMAIFIQTLVGDTMKELTALLKDKKCKKTISGTELQAQVRIYAARHLWFHGRHKTGIR